QVNAERSISERTWRWHAGRSDRLAKGSKPTMKNQILSGCIAALILGASCDDKTEKTETPKPVEIKAVKVETPGFIRDAGEMTKIDEVAKPVDPLAIATDD